MKGLTKIELFERGKLVKQFEKHNTVTGALAEIFKPLGMYHNGSLFNGYNGYNLTRLFGGLLAFDKSIDESVIFAPADAAIVASAVYNAANNGNNQIRGTYNATESNLDFANRKLKFVYDFSTNQGNGDIAAVCLCPLYGGYINDGADRSQTSIDGFPLDEMRTECEYDDYGNCYGSDWSGIYPRYGCLGFGYLGRRVSYFGTVNTSGNTTDSAVYRIMGVFDNKMVVARLMVSGTAITLRLEKYPALISEVNVWDAFGGTYAAETEDISLGDSLFTLIYNNYAWTANVLGMNYDWENKKFYVTCALPTNPVYFGPGYDSSRTRPCATGAAIRVFEVDMTTKAVTQYDITNQAGVPLVVGTTSSRYEHTVGQYVYNGYLYMAGWIPHNNNRSDYDWGYTGTNIYKIQLSNPANVQTIELANFNYYNTSVIDAHNGKIYFRLADSSATRVMNTVKKTIAYEEFNCNDSSFAVAPIDGYTALALNRGHAVGLRPNTLMTINNITKVTKTSAQTMKITYTLSEG